VVCTGARGKARFRRGGRASLRVVVGCGLLVALGPPAAQARPRLEGHPKPPSQAQINAAENQVRQHQAALWAAQGKLSAASAELRRHVPARRAYRCRPPGGLTDASGPEGLSWLSTWP
jgi:hypothetical protein